MGTLGKGNQNHSVNSAGESTLIHNKESSQHRMKQRWTRTLLSPAWRKCGINYDNVGNYRNGMKLRNYLHTSCHHYPNFAKATQELIDTNREIIANVLGVGVEDVLKVPKKPVTTENATQSKAILQRNGYGIGEMLNMPGVFMMTPGSVENYIEIMKESCFHQIKFQWIIKTVHKQQLGYLEKKKLALPPPEILRKYFETLEILGTPLEDSIWDALPVDISRLALIDLRREITRRYLSWKLDIDLETVTEAFSTYPRIGWRCFQWTKDSLNILTKEFGLTGEKIVKHLYLILSDPKHLSQLSEIPSLSGMPLKALVQHRPKILMSQKSTLLEIQDLYDKHNIARQSIRMYPEIYTLSTATIQKRLEELDEIPEFRPFKKHPRVARLIYYQTKAKSRLAAFALQNMSGASLHLLSSDSKRYKRLLSLGEIKSRGSDVVTYLTDYFSDEIKGDLIRKNLMRQKNWLHSSVKSVKDGIMFLESYKVFSKPQLFSALPLILYPLDKLKVEIDNVVKSGEAKLTDPFFLHMVLYFLERAVHFSGDAVWNQEFPIPQDDDDHSTKSENTSAENQPKEDDFFDELNERK